MSVTALEPPERVFRAMRKAEDGEPSCGSTANRLGVRPGADISPDVGQMVYPRTGGMSVAPDAVERLPPHVRPRNLPGGFGKLPVYELERARAGSQLVVRRDPTNPSRHAFVEPATRMTLDELQDVLCSTRAEWEEVPTWPRSW